MMNQVQSPLPITDPSQLADLVQTDNAEIRGYLQARPGLHALVDLKYRIYAVSQPHARRMLYELTDLVGRIYEKKPELQEITESVFSTLSKKPQQASFSKISKDKARDGNQRVEELLEQAINLGASDIHVRAWHSGAAILVRVNQMLQPLALNLSYEDTMLIIRSIYSARCYGEASFKADDVCDASFQYTNAARNTYMVRLNSVPDVRGTTMVARLRNPHEIIDIRHSGYHDSQLQASRRIMSLNGGLMLYTGPTNSGKSTSTTAWVSEIPVERYVLEIGDPIEVHLPRVTHVELKREGEGADARIARVFAATVRQDTDVLVLGEIRDQLTAAASESMAIQGKFVLSTLHTESVTTAVPRLIELGVSDNVVHAPGFLVGLVSQKLIPLTCQACASKEPSDAGIPHQHYQKHLLGDLPGELRYRNPEGCAACRYTGIGGQTLVAEVLEISKPVRALIAARDYDAIEDYMWENGILNKHRHALLKVREGLLDPSIVESRINPFTPDNLRGEWAC